MPVRGSFLVEIAAFAALAAGAARVLGLVGQPAEARADQATSSTADSLLSRLPIRLAAPGPAGRFLGIEDDLALAYLRSQPLVEAKLNRGGSSISLRLKFAEGSHAAFKPEQIHPQTVPRKEVAAYRLNRLLGLGAVPPATMRLLHRDEITEALAADAGWAAARLEAEARFDDEGLTRGEISLWIPTIVKLRLDSSPEVEQWTIWLTVGQPLPEDKEALLAQLSTLLVFDLLQNNSDRFSGGNLLASSDGKTLYYMDNTFGFQADPEGNLKCRTYLARCQKFSRTLVDRLRRLDLSQLRDALASEPGVLTDQELRAVLGRRDVALRHIDRLIDEHGAEQVLVFP